MSQIKVAIIMGSDSDFPSMKKAVEIFVKFGVKYFITVASAHRTPDKVIELTKRAETEDWKIFIAGAGMAAHLAGFIAAHTVKPVIGVPMDSSALNGLDSLLSTVQMPGGVPVATMGLGSAGAKNAALFAVEILALTDDDLEKKLLDYRKEQALLIEEKAAEIEKAN
ncbi:MAG: 5-(carboxyamino)imidazole ribonucleotide mutase [Syntrophaceae bacterium]|nr:5-(carboxyamino)imidazole ribonucleotide mutase [Syntrophaceae bacterium]